MSMSDTCNFVPGYDVRSFRSYNNSGVTLLFEHWPSRASEIDYF